LDLVGGLMDEWMGVKPDLRDYLAQCPKSKNPQFSNFSSIGKLVQFLKGPKLLGSGARLCFHAKYHLSLAAFQTLNGPLLWFFFLVKTAPESWSVSLITIILC
jgi:hypothetical protein